MKKREIEKIEKDIKEGKNIEGPFYTAEEFMKNLRSKDGHTRQNTKLDKGDPGY